MKKVISVILCSILLSVCLSGCQGAARKPQTQDTPQSNNQLDVSASERRVMASQLSQVAESVPNVQKATVVVTNYGSTTGGLQGPNNTAQLVALVGLTVSAAASNDANLNNTTKKAVAEKLKASENRLYQVLVTSDPGMIQRINDVAAGIVEGKPVQSYETDINSLTTDLKQQKAIY